MQLHYMPNSPFARKVVAVAKETGQIDRITLVATEAVPVKPNSALTAINPLTRVPVLVLADGRSIVDSRVICEYLDSLHDGAKIFPIEPGPRLTALQQQAIADGICEAVSINIYEFYVRPKELGWQAWQRAHTNKTRTALRYFEAQMDDVIGQVTIGTLSIACALAVIDYAMPDLDWRTEVPTLAAWYAEFNQRPSLEALPQPQS